MIQGYKGYTTDANGVPHTWRFDLASGGILHYYGDAARVWERSGETCWCWREATAQEFDAARVALGFVPEYAKAPLGATFLPIVQREAVGALG